MGPYRLTIDTYIAPTLGDVPLHALGPAAIEQLYGELLDHGGRGDRPLSLATIRHVHAVLHKALAAAIPMDLLPSNPADRVALPRRDLRDDAPATVQAWTAEEARRFLRRTRDDVHACLWTLALGTGMRRGELLALRWRDVSFDDRLVTVARSLTEHRGHTRRKATKTNRVRRLYIDERTAAALEREVRRRRPRTTTAPPDLADLVFTDEGGGPLSPPAHDPSVPPAGPPLGRHPTTAVNWVNNAAGDWNNYAALIQDRTPAA